MSSLSDVTSVMGEYMLKGWVLTDKQCSSAGCAVPLMRSPRGQTPEVWFCAKCNGAPIVSDHTGSQAASTSNSTVTNMSTRFSTATRSSTPQTEVESEAHDDEEFVLAPESEESRRRREQSDRASAELGNRLLRGWAMLGEECPSESCFGIPLVMPPNQPNGVKDLRKECVICGNVYLPQGTQSESPEIARQEERSHGLVQEPIVQTPPMVPRFAPDVRLPTHAPISENAARQETSTGPLNALSTTDRALQNTLNALTSRLDTLASSASMDVNAVGNTADAIGKVIQALGHVKTMQWSEAQAKAL